MVRYLNPVWLQAFNTTPPAPCDRRRAFLEGVLYALDSKGHVGRHAATLPSALVAVIRAQAALDGHASARQPRGELLGRVINASKATVAQAVPAYRLGGRAEHAATWRELTAVSALMTRTKNSPTQPQTKQAAVRLDGLLAPLSKVIRSWATMLWDGVVTDQTLAEQMTAEVAVLVALEGRDTNSLFANLLRLLRKATTTASEVEYVLWPQPTSHQVTLLVHGARQLVGLVVFVPGSSQEQLWAGQEEDELPTSAPLRKFVRFVGPMGSAATLVSAYTDAADPGTAARIARRELSEALDHYAAGDRLIDLHLAPEWLVQSPGDKDTMGSTRSPGRRAAHPLTRFMPLTLRAAMRAANLARLVDAPMASSALAWSALESTGLPADEAERLAEACALQTLRRHLASAHNLIVSASRARIDHQRHCVMVEKGQVKKHEVAIHRCADAESPKAKSALVAHTELAQLARERVEKEERILQAAEASVTADLSAVEAHAMTQGREEYLLSIDAWLDILLPPQTTDSPSLRTAQAAAERLATHGGGLAAETFVLWRSLLANPSNLADWLKRQTSMYRGVLEWLYATRNMAIHRGHFTAPSDELTAHAARGIVDMALEFVSNWHTVERSRAVTETTAAEIYRHLGARLTELDTYLRTPGALCHHLRVDHISGPDPTWWVGGIAAGKP